MKILHVYRDLLRKGGIPHQTRRLVTSQAQLGYQVGTVSLNGDLKEVFIKENPSVKVEYSKDSFAAIDDFRQCLNNFKPDLVHITGLWIPLHQLWTWEIIRVGIPYVVSTHGNLNPLNMNVRFGEKKTKLYHILAKRLWHRYLDLPLLRNAIGIHAHSRYESELLHSAGLKNVFVVPAGVDDDWLNDEGIHLRKYHKRKTFLHLGRLDIYHKGLDLICEVAKKLVKAGLGKQCKFLFVGPTVNNSREILHKLSNQLDHEILEIREPAWGQAKQSVLEEADYFLNVYRLAGIALAPCEAMGYGLPLLASREGNLGDWTAEAKMGWTVPLDSQKLFTLFEKILNFPDHEYHRLSINAWNFAKNNSWNNVGQKIIGGYNILLKKSRAN